MKEMPAKTWADTRIRIASNVVLVGSADGAKERESVGFIVGAEVTEGAGVVGDGVGSPGTGVGCSVGSFVGSLGPGAVDGDAVAVGCHDAVAREVGTSVGSRFLKKSSLPSSSLPSSSL